MFSSNVYLGIQDWPEFDFGFDIQNMCFKLYGGSQYERLLNEFEYVAHSREFPSPSMNEVASALGAAKSHNVPVFETAVCTLNVTASLHALTLVGRPLILCKSKRGEFCSR